MSVHLKFSTTIATLLFFQRKKVFENSLNTSWYIAFCRGSVKGKIEIFTFSECWKSCNVAIGKRKGLYTLNSQRRYSHLYSSFSEKKVFENSLNTSGDIAFLPGQGKGKKWNLYIFRMLEKLQRCYWQNENVCVLQIFNHSSQLPLLSFKKKFLIIR